MRIIAAAAWFLISARKESVRPLTPAWLVVRMAALPRPRAWLLEEMKGQRAVLLKLPRVSCEVAALEAKGKRHGPGMAGKWALKGTY